MAFELDKKPFYDACNDCDGTGEVGGFDPDVKDKCHCHEEYGNEVTGYYVNEKGKEIVDFLTEFGFLR